MDQIKLILKYTKVKKILSIILLVILITAIPTTVIVLQRQQEIRQQAAGETIDTLQYFVSDHPDRALTGSHPMTQTVVGNRSYYVKFNNPNSYEIHTWDDQYIYLKEDHFEDPNDWNIYTFDPGIWLKRQMTIGETIDMRTNRLQYYNNACQPIAQNRIGSPSDIFRYEMTLESHNPNAFIDNVQGMFNGSEIQIPPGNLGTQDVIVVKYDYFAGNFERFYYSKEWGWIMWEGYSNNQLINRAVFNRILDEHVLPKFNVCDPVLRPNTITIAPTAPNPTSIPTITNTPTPTTNSSTPTPTRSNSPTNTPRLTRTPTPTLPSNTTILKLQLYLQGVGKGQGDNPSPDTDSREVSVEVFDTNNTRVGNLTGLVDYNSTTGLFEGTIALPNTLNTGNYVIKVKTPRYLTKTILRNNQQIIPITKGTTNNLPQTNLLIGDVNNDNILDIKDYNILLACGYGEINPLPMTNTSSKFNSPNCQNLKPSNNSFNIEDVDLDDNGVVNDIDYNRFIRNLINQQGN